MAKPAIKRSCRMIDMMQRLRDAWVTKEQLAATYGVSLRTVERDLADLESEPIYAAVVNDGKAPVRFHIISGKRGE
jgi:predicted DNA-binding transcriptional regulator YafY